MITPEQETEPLRIAFVVAVADNGVIGRNGTLPWRLSSDLKYFRRVTTGKPVIMGRKTYQSIGKPLPDRDNIVLTRDADFVAPDGVHVVTSPGEALALALRCAYARSVREIAVIGGAEIYRLLLPRANRLYLTRVHASPDGDATFDVDPAEWREIARSDMPRTERDDHPATFITYDRR